MLAIFFLSFTDTYFSKLTFRDFFSGIQSECQNSLDQDQAQRFVGSGAKLFVMVIGRHDIEL